MAARAAGKKLIKKGKLKSDAPPYLRTIIRSAMATPSPPLGPQLGEVITIRLMRIIYFVVGLIGARLLTNVINKKK